MKKYFSIIFSFLVVNSFAQAPNYSENVASILYNSCTECHHNGGIAPFSLMTFQDASNNASQIVLSVVSGEMPPWPVDSTFQRYAHERILSLAEINTIVEWNNNGALEGNPALAPTPPTYTGGAILPYPDYTLNLPIYTSTAVNEDDYVCFKMPTNFTTDRIIKAVEIIPGNLSIVHHVLVNVDTSIGGQMITQNCMGSEGIMIGGYVPGSTPNIFPNGSSVNMGVTLPAGASINVQMHYPKGSSGMIDSTKVNFFFYPIGTTGVREVVAGPVLQDWSFSIPANTIQTFNIEYPGGGASIPYDISVLSVSPHMHLLGTKITTYAVTSNNDTIPFARINDWDFEWQGFYSFKNILKVPAGSILYAEATFDNTSNNLTNPNNPPQLVLPGEATTDEMFLVFFQFLLYQQGDENIVLEDYLSLGIKDNSINAEFKTFSIFPNPVDESFNVLLEINNKVEYKILNIEGKIVQTGTLNSNKDISIKKLPSGNYICFIQQDNIFYTSKFIKK